VSQRINGYASLSKPSLLGPEAGNDITRWYPASDSQTERER